MWQALECRMQALLSAGRRVILLGEQPVSCRSLLLAPTVSP